MIISLNWWKWLLFGCALGAMTMTLYAWQASAEARGALKILQTKLDEQIELTVEAAEKADEAEARAIEADATLARVSAEEEAVRERLEEQIASRNRTIARLRIEQDRVIGQLEILREAIMTAEPNVVADGVQNFMDTDYPQFPGSEFELRSADFFFTNDPGSRAILTGFTDAAARVKIIALANEQNTELQSTVDEVRGLATSLNTQLEFTEVDLERWREAFTMKEGEVITLENQIMTQTEMIATLEKKNFWEKIPEPVKAGMMFGIGVALGSQLK